MYVSGGAFIKVETGEMYRVKSVQSKPNDDDDDDDSTEKTEETSNGNTVSTFLFECR